MSTETWKSGATADYDTPADWTGGLPEANDTAVINQGTVELTSADASALPAPLTFVVGFLQLSAFTIPTSVLWVINADLPASVTISNQS